MANRKKEYPVPKFRDLEEEDKYWQSRSPLMEGYEGKVQKKKQNKASFLSIRLTGEQLAQLRETATHYGLGPSTYARQVILQAMDTGIGTLPPSLLMSMCSYTSTLSGESKERYMEQLNKIYRNFLAVQESTAAQMASLCIPDLLFNKEGLKQTQEEKAER